MKQIFTNLPESGKSEKYAFSIMKWDLKGGQPGYQGI